MEQEEIKRLFTYSENSYLIRNFDWNSNKARKGDIAGSIRKDGYSTIRINRKAYYVHRLIWVYHNGAIPDNLVVDHIDENPANNKIDNLQLLTRRENMAKQKVALGKVPFRGVVKTPFGTFQAAIRNGKKRECLGTYKTPEEAARAYDARAIAINGHIAKLNFPVESG